MNGGSKHTKIRRVEKRTALSNEYIGNSDSDTVPSSLPPQKIQRKCAASTTHKLVPRPSTRELKNNKPSGSKLPSKSRSSESRVVHNHEGIEHDLPSSNQNGTSKKAPSNSAVVSKGADQFSISRPPMLSNSPNPEGPSSESSTDISGNGSQDSDSEIEVAPRMPPTRSSSARQEIVSRSFEPYQPPDGFEIASISLPHTSDLRHVFSASNLATKEIWHLTLPSSIPVTTLQEVSMQAMLGGKVTLTHKDTDYGFSTEKRSSHSGQHLLIPSMKHSNYAPTFQSISRTLHLEQLIRFPLVGERDRERPTEANSKVATTHEQPEGLRMRYWPFGDTESRLERLGPSIASKIDDKVNQCILVPKFCKHSESALPDKPTKRKALHIDEADTEFPKISKPKKLKSSKADINAMDRMVKSAPLKIPVNDGGSSQSNENVGAMEYISTAAELPSEEANEKLERRARRAKRKEKSGKCWRPIGYQTWPL